jgi:hypothetical protein
MGSLDSGGSPPTATDAAESPPAGEAAALARVARMRAFAREIAGFVRDGRCTLFLGAGIHNGPGEHLPYDYPKEKRPVQGGELCKHLGELCQFSAVPEFAHYATDLQKVSEYYRLSFERNSLLREIRNLVVTGREPSPALRWLARLNFPLILTSNYDRLFERALRDAGKEPEVSIYNKDRKSVTHDRQEQPDRATPMWDPQTPFLLKLHGDIGDAEDADGDDKARDSIVITEEDYLEFVMRLAQKEPQNPIPHNVVHRLAKGMILFIGYSLKDYNLRLLFRSLRWEKDFSKIDNSYAVDKHHDPIISAVLKSHEYKITPVTADFWEFIPMLYKEVTGAEVESCP